MSLTCPSCNAVSPSGAHFCAACGAGLAAAPPVASTSSARVAKPKMRSPLHHLDDVLENAEWKMIAEEPTSAPQVFWGYGAVLGAIEPICSILGYFVHGEPVTHQTFNSVLSSAVLNYLSTLMVSFILAYGAIWIAKGVGATSSVRQTMKIVIYGQTPLFLIGVLALMTNTSGILLWVAIFVVISNIVVTVILFDKGATFVLGLPRIKARLFAVILFVLDIVLIIVAALPSILITRV